MNDLTEFFNLDQTLSNKSNYQYSLSYGCFSEKIDFREFPKSQEVRQYQNRVEVYVSTENKHSLVINTVASKPV